MSNEDVQSCMSRNQTATVNTTALRRQAKRAIDRMSGLPLRFAADFLTYIEERHPDGATKELLEIPGFADSLKRGLKDVRSGRVKAWRKARADV